MCTTYHWAGCEQCCPSDLPSSSHKGFERLPNNKFCGPTVYTHGVYSMDVLFAVFSKVSQRDFQVTGLG